MPNMNTHFHVKNLNGTAGKRCRCSSWLAHWRGLSGQMGFLCGVRHCTSRAAVGGHVRDMDGRSDNRHYIVPLCAEHNHHTNARVMILSADVIVEASRGCP